MNTNGQGKQLLQEAATISTQTAFWNSLRMLVAAILCGLAVSLAAAGIALVLSSEAEARLIQREPTSATPELTRDADLDAVETPASPGVLLAGIGCDAAVLQAVERDWQIRIGDNRIEVRVMQTFQLPANSTEFATFSVQLPEGARLRNLSAQTPNKDWPGRLLSENEYDRIVPAEYMKLTRNYLLVTHSPAGAVATSPIMFSGADGILTVQYTYEILSGNSTNTPGLTLSLADPLDHQAVLQYSFADDRAERSALSGTVSTKGAIWVEWVTSRPMRVWGIPSEASIESLGARVDGFSWATGDIGPNSLLQLAWRY